jgi:sulfur-oxidizing protein SoxY
MMRQTPIKETRPMALPIKSFAGVLALAVVAAALLAAPAAKADEDVWPALKQQTFGDRPIAAEDGVVTLDAPYTADDPALVPITVHVPPGIKQKIKTLTLFIDKNPDPMVAKITFGQAAGLGGERSFSTRVRIDNFSHVRAVLETEDGQLHMATKFVAASGGCGAMQAKDPDTEDVDLGKMIVKTFPPALSADPIWSAQVMIKHPNSNGMQLDINTANVIPARFVKDVVVKRDGELVFQLEGTFSISTNPNFRFTFGRGPDNVLDVAITDTDGAVFTEQSAPSGS